MVYFLQNWIVNPMLNLLKRTMTYPGFEPGTFGVAVSIPTEPIAWRPQSTQQTMKFLSPCELQTLHKIDKKRNGTKLSLL
jgi:hypothetical protein